jgi:acyl transferase domain-containing protein
MENMNGYEIAVIGISCRFPGAPDLLSFWNNIKGGVESISFFTKEELLSAGADPLLLNNENYVRANGFLEDADIFDHSFFGYSRREAEIMDPQHRLFLQEAYKALDDAGYGNSKMRGHTAVFAGCDLNTYLINNLLPNVKDLKDLGDFQIMIGNDKDYLNTRVSYQLNLTGPSVSIQTACSTSLSAIHFACQSILSGECEMALAGGASVRPPQKAGYLHLKNMITSPDGHCRPFDDSANGIVGGNGVAAVVLKLYTEALRDGDNIYGIIKGSAINNDGKEKAGYTAPGVRGQSQVIKEAIEVAKVSPDSIGYVEAHGTGTKIGDPIEVSALKKVFEVHTDKKNFCALGSVKANIGHTSAAAGIAGFIKSIMVVKYGLIPPCVNFRTSNKAIDFENSPFYISTKLESWKLDSKLRRRAAVSSFGIGGTNVHIVVEASATETTVRPVDSPMALSLSAKRHNDLEKMCNQLVEHISNCPGISMVDVAFTLHTGRENLPFRRTIACYGIDDALEKLRQKGDSMQVTDERLPIYFIFPGQGLQYVDMARQLYNTMSLFRKTFDDCSEKLKRWIDYDIRKIVYPNESKRISSAILLSDTKYIHPILFSIEYALTSTFIDLGIKPTALLGHSLGEYTAACIGGVFSLDDALRIVCKRGEIMSRVHGMMLSVVCTKSTLESLINSQISIAAVNGPSSCVVSGSEKAIEDLSQVLEKKKIAYSRIKITTPFHSPLLEPILMDLHQLFNETMFHQSTIPIISNLTGKPFEEGEAQNPDYWVRHARHTIQFDKCVNFLQRNRKAIFIEVGPGNFLSSLIKQGALKTESHHVYPSLPPKKENFKEDVFFLECLGKCWGHGVRIHWEKLYQQIKCGKVSLPSYPFQREKIWIEAKPLDKVFDAVGYSAAVPDEYLYEPVWRQSSLDETSPVESSEDFYMIFSSNSKAECSFLDLLRREGKAFVTVRAGKSRTLHGDHHFEMDPACESDYKWLVECLEISDYRRLIVINFWLYESHDPGQLTMDKLSNHHDRGFYNFLYTVKATSQMAKKKEVIICGVVNGLISVTGDEKIIPSKASLIGAAKIIPGEYSNHSCFVIDVTSDFTDPFYPSILAKLIHKEILGNTRESVVAYRGRQRFTISYEKHKTLSTQKPKLTDGGTYLITGGLGGIGFTIAELIAEEVSQPTLILVGRTGLPPRHSWNHVLDGSRDEQTVQKISTILKLEDLGAKVQIIPLDISNADDIEILRAHIEAQHINGVFHAAAVADYHGIIRNRSSSTIEDIFAPKIKGTLLLDSILDYSCLDFFVLCSSMSTVWFKTKVGQIAYVAANEFIDAFAYYNHHRGHIQTTTLNWCDWRKVGISEKANKEWAQKLRITEDHMIFQNSITPTEGQRIFGKVISLRRPRLLVSKEHPSNAIQRFEQFDLQTFLRGNAEDRSVEDKSVEFRQHSTIAPETELQAKIAHIWSDFLGASHIGIDDNFFESGGHSLLAIQVMAKINDLIGNQTMLSVDDFYKYPTIQQLAEFIENKTWVSESKIFQGSDTMEEGEV